MPLQLPPLERLCQVDLGQGVVPLLVDPQLLPPIVAVGIGDAVPVEGGAGQPAAAPADTGGGGGGTAACLAGC